MLEFTKVTPDKFSPFAEYFRNETINEYGVIPYCSYSNVDNANFCIFNDCLIIRCFEKNELFYTISGNPHTYKPAIEEIKKTCEKVKIEIVSEAKKDILLKLYPHAELYTHDSSQFDYLYKISDFLNLSGKAARHKRENYKKFVKNFDFRYEEINDKNINDCLKICDRWCDRKDCSACEYACERTVLQFVTDNYKSLPVCGGFLYIENQPVAFFMGETVGNILMGYHQKTVSTSHTGIGYAIYIESLKNSFSDVEYFNIGPDIGIPGLRQFKQQFKPYEMVKKYYMYI